MKEKYIELFKNNYNVDIIIMNSIDKRKFGTFDIDDKRNDILLYNFEDEEEALIAAFHELGHILNLKYEYILKIDLEMKAWETGITEMKKHNIKMTHRMSLFMLECLSTYMDYEIREYTISGLINIRWDNYDKNGVRDLERIKSQDINDIKKFLYGKDEI